MKERITITLDKHLLKHVDSLIDGQHYKNRSYVIENVLMSALHINRPKKACILAGGRGKRLKPITDELPPSMLPVQGKPLLEHIIRFFKMYDITDILLFVGFKSDVIKKHFGDGTKFGVRITYLQESTPLGTAGALLQAKDLLTETFVVSNGDELKNFDLLDMFRFHKKSNAPATIALTQVENPQDYGAVRLRGNRIISFKEKSKASMTTSLVSAGLYLFEPTIFSYIGEGKSHFERDVFPQLVEEESIVGYPFDGQWFDMGSFDQYEIAIREWKG